MSSTVKLCISAFLPVILSVLIYVLDKKTPCAKIPYMIKQAIIGILFGTLAVVGTEWGIPMNGAQVNARDAAVLSAGLLFGSPAGIIAGLIGGIERWFAVYWGVGTFTRLACTLSTIIAGVYAALLRKYMFEDKKPGWLISLAIGVVMEIFHLTMVFITNMNDPTRAMEVVRACTAPMVAANGLSVMLAALALTIISEKPKKYEGKNVRISQTIQRWLLVTVMLAFVATSYFVFSLQNTIASTQTDTLLENSLEETKSDIRDASDASLLSIARRVAKEVQTSDLPSLAKEYELAEISVINKDGKIVRSTDPAFIGFDMSSGDQAAEFLCLLGDTQEFVQQYGPISSSARILRKYAGIKTDFGFVQVGYDADTLQNDIASQVVGLTKNRRVGESGYIVIMDQSRSVVSAPKDADLERLSNDVLKLQMPEEDKTFSDTICGVSVFCSYENSEGYFLLSVLPESEALQMRNIALYVNTFMEILVFAILFGLIYFLIKSVVVNQIKSINSSLSKISSGDLDTVVDVRSNAEFASLSDDINSTVSTLKHYIAEASARIDKELEFAKNIQSSALPNVFPAFPRHKDFDIYAMMDPAKEVGGDFYDFYLTHDEKLHFLVADVSGKGIPAAMFMMRAKTELKSLTETDMPISDVFTRGNESLCEGNDAGMFVTAWQGGIDLESGKMLFANAGHNPPLVMRAETGRFEYLRTRAGFVLAGMEGVRYKTQELQLYPGDVVFLYTDGVTEAQNAESELFGEERLLEAINARVFEDCREICEFIKSEVDAFVKDAPQFDDITMVALKYIGTPPAPTISFENASIDDIPAVTDFITEELEKINCPMKIQTQFSIAIDEIYSNIVKYAYDEKSGPVSVQLIVKEDPALLYLRFTDEGIPYNPLTKDDPDVTLSAEDRSIGGLGIFMVKKTMDDMRYKYENGQNVLTIMKKL